MPQLLFMDLWWVLIAEEAGEGTGDRGCGAVLYIHFLVKVPTKLKPLSKLKSRTEQSS